MPDKGQRITVYDTKIPKLACRVTHAGARTFYVVTRVRGEMEWLHLGSLSEMTVEQARKQAAKILGQFAEGKNPAEAKREAKSELTLGEAFRTYMSNHVVAHGIKSADNLIQMWERCLGKMPDTPKKKHSRPRTKHPQGVNWDGTKLGQITRDDVEKLHVAMGKTTPILANRVIELLSAIFNRLGLQNPTAGIKPFKEQKRDRFLQEAELPRFFSALSEDTSTDFRDFVTLALLTGARRGNVLAMRWADIDFDRAVWRIRGAEFKNGELMDIPLVPEAISILTARKPNASGSFVFPADSKTGHMTPPKKRWAQLFDRAELTELTKRIAAVGGEFKWLSDGTESLERALIRARAMTSELKIDTRGARLHDLRLHDLRRSLGSWQAILGASLPIVGRSLGHKSPAATAIYARLHIDPVRASVEAATSKMLVMGGVKREQQPAVRKAGKRARARSS